MPTVHNPIFLLQNCEGTFSFYFRICPPTPYTP
jgi:hypothetical protein